MGPSRISISGRNKVVWLTAILLLSLGVLGQGLSASAQTTGTGTVYVAEIHGEIGLGTAPFLRDVISSAEDDGAAAVVLDINTPGGRLDSALDMKNTLLGARVPTIAFVNREAFSAGALIAISTNRIYMTPGGVIGAATPVDATGETASEKIVSAVRSAFRSVAEARGLDPDIAESMVDPAVQIDGLVASGKLLTMTTSQALDHSYARAQVADLQEVLAAEGLGGAAVRTVRPGFSTFLIELLTNPLVSFALIALGVIGIVYELITPGIGVGGIVGVIALALFFWSHLNAGLAGWEGVVLVFVGAVLILLEALVIPGFGVAGILGIITFLAGLFISLIGDVPTTGDYIQALLVLLSSLLTILVSVFLVIRYLPTRPVGGLVHLDRLARLTGGTDEHGAIGAGLPLGALQGSLVGKTGEVVNELHPAGTALIDGRRVDVVSEEGYSVKGTMVEVVLDEGYRRVVRNISAGPKQERGDGSP